MMTQVHFCNEVNCSTALMYSPLHDALFLGLCHLAVLATVLRIQVFMVLHSMTTNRSWSHTSFETVLVCDHPLHVLVS